MGQDAQFYLGHMIDERAVIERLAHLFGVRVSSLNHSDDEAPVFLSTETMSGDFPLSLMVTWPDKISGPDNTQVAIDLARYFNTRVLTDLPLDHLLARDPFVWCLAEPSGELLEISQDIERSDVMNGIVLDESTRKVVA